MNDWILCVFKWLVEAVSADAASLFFVVMIYFLTLFVILNEVKNLKTFTLCTQILRYAQDDIKC